MEIDLSITKLERNFGFKHIIKATGKSVSELPVNEIVNELDSTLCYLAINDYTKFVLRVFQIVAHQTYHVEIDENAETTYNAISYMLKSGKGNPRIDKLEDVLNTLGVSIAVCSLKDREEIDVPRACFFQHLVKNQRWKLSDVIDLLFTYGMHLRAFTLEASQENNTLEVKHSYNLLGVSDVEHRETVKGIEKVTSLLQFFNVLPIIQFNVLPVNAYNIKRSGTKPTNVKKQ